MRCVREQIYKYYPCVLFDKNLINDTKLKQKKCEIEFIKFYSESFNVMHDDDDDDNVLLKQTNARPAMVFIMCRRREH